MRAVLVFLVLLPAAGCAKNGLANLTAEGLPAGCTLPQIPFEGSHVRGGFWDLPSNPWVFSDAAQIARFTAELNTSAPMRDGPADGIEEGYIAVYREGRYGNPTLVIGVRFPTAAAAQASLLESRFEQLERWKAADDGTSFDVLQGGSVVVLVEGGGDCYDPVLAHIELVLGHPLSFGRLVFQSDVRLLAESICRNRRC